ncbi:MAG: hypothetical protein JSW11_07560 [Candidatus Heimdallarchaeota archaeon]|nr:MAG: hypothetical protein JSW11_07560 [Candidatus Heimdallarchaeota archaeon]
MKNQSKNRERNSSRLSKLGYKLPREHGLTGIWLISVLLGVGLSLTGKFHLEGLLLSLTFSILVILSSNSIIETIKRKSTGISWIPLLSIFIIVFLIIIWKPVWEILLVLAILGLLTSGWFVFALQSRQLSPYELIFGSIAFTMMTPFIFIVSTIHIPIEISFKAFTISWINIGVTSLMILYVESLRGKVPTNSPLVVWSFFLVSFIPLILVQWLHPISLIAVIEPTFLSVHQAWKKELLKVSKKPIKTVGIQLLLRLFVFGILILVTIPITFNL